MVKKDRPTIAIMSSVINWWYGNTIIRGIRSVAEERGVNLRIFSGWHINSPFSAEKQRNIVYQMINEQNSDGIIAISAGLCGYLTPAEEVEYFSRYKSLPLIGIGDFPGTIPHILVDNKKGMSELMEHLLGRHGYRKIAFLSGPVSNEEALVRLGVYKDSLEKWGIAVDPAYIFYGTFNWVCAKEAVSQFLDKEGLEPEVIVCANDDMAFGVYHELLERGLSIPGDIRVTGFDDVQEPRYLLTSFTTVRQPYFELGSRALELILDKIEQGTRAEKRPIQEFLPAKLVIRKSCGCGQREEQRDLEALELEGLELDEQLSRSLIDKLGSFYSLSTDKVKETIGRLYDTLTADLEDPNSSAFLDLLKELVSKSNITYDEINRWNNIISIFSNHILGSTNKSALLKRLVNLLNEANYLIESARVVVMGKLQGKIHLRHFLSLQTIETINRCQNFNELLQVVLEQFPKIDLTCFYLSFYGTRLKAFPAALLPEEEARLLLGPEGEQIIRYPGDTTFPAGQLVPGGDFSFRKNNTFIVKPICSDGNFFGFIVIEFFEDKLEIYEPMVDLLCTAVGYIWHLDLVRIGKKEVEEANKKLKDLDTAKTNFMANISHELRTPLTMILGPLESLIAGDYDNGEHGEDKSTVKKIYHAMHTNSVRLLRQINNLLDFSKIEAGKMKLTKKKTDMTKLLDFYINSVQSGIQSRGLTVGFICPGNKIYCSIDRDLMEKAFFNLISNAIKFSHKGEKITVRLIQENGKVLIVVEDRGIGISPDQLESVFERFTQVEQSSSRKFEGTGIGLAFTKEIIELHKGTISVESTPGKGSVFTITLPTGLVPRMDRCDTDKNQQLLEEEEGFEVHSWLTAEFLEEGEDGEGEGGDGEGGEDPEDGRGKVGEKKQPPRLKPGESAEPAEKGAYILVVDDNSTIRDFIKGLLEKKYRVRSAIHGKQALEVIKEGLPDLIISDVMMPEMDGLELCRILKEKRETARIPIILLTARLDMTTRIEGLEGRADDYLIKPFNARELYARILNLLKRYRLEQQLQKTTDALWSELETAKQIQNSLLPKKPAIPGFDIACYIQSASEVGGDYYDVIHTGAASYLVIGDVSGHGITAGLVMMMVQTGINILLSKHPDIRPSELITDINRTIKNNIRKLGQEKYMTISVFALVEKGRFLFSGLHQDILIYRAAAGSIDVLETSGMWIGFVDDISDLIKDETFELEKGDTLLLYTDGITEAVRKEWVPGEPDKRFGDTKLIKTLKKYGHGKPEEIKTALKKELENYQCNDDFTFLIVQRK